ncbi:hypothetical protein J7S78_13920 [Klebsiella oxytoca]|uniref:Beta sliding clamp n=1 Tax=Klebsiella oxytoca TaxID=571 RepID=A0AAP2BJB7_KLEOX|nr:DNA polymerase III subunit beta [Klebsiella oxytoca]MBQ0600891.1 hypothetical protein [Klebsiella oxytoca]
MTTVTKEQDKVSTAKKKKLTIKDMPGFDISSTDMSAIIDPACMIVKKSGNIFQALEMITLTLVGNELSVLAVDIDTAQVLSRGKVALSCGDMKASIPALQLSNLMRSMKSVDNIRFRYDSDESKLIVKASKSTYKLPVFVGDIPVIEEELLKPEFNMSFPQEMLYQNVQRILHCAARNDVRYYMNGIYLNILDNSLFMVATDGHRMATTKNTILIKDKPEEGLNAPLSSVDMKGQDVGVILPIGVCPIMQKILKGQKGDVRMEFCSHNVIFHFDTIRMVCNLVDGKYPRWAQITRGVKQASKTFTANLLDLRESMSRAINLLTSGSASKESPGKCNLSFRSNEIVISSPENNSVDCEEIVSATLVEGEQEECLIGINGHYLLDAINGMLTYDAENAKVEIKIKDSTSGIYFKYGDTLDVIMPLRL